MTINMKQRILVLLTALAAIIGLSSLQTPVQAATVYNSNVFTRTQCSQAVTEYNDDARECTKLSWRNRYDAPKHQVGVLIERIQWCASFQINSTGPFYAGFKKDFDRLYSIDWSIRSNYGTLVVGGPREFGPYYGDSAAAACRTHDMELISGKNNLTLVEDLNAGLTTYFDPSWYHSIETIE